MRIGELAATVGVTPDTVRFYEREGLLPAARRTENGYRDYSRAEADHLRLLIDLRRLEVPLPEAARIAGYCHVGHCGETTETLPGVIGERRRAIRQRIAGLETLDARLADLERHLRARSRRLPVLAVDGACCDAAAAVKAAAGDACACCSPAAMPS